MSYVSVRDRQFVRRAYGLGQTATLGPAGSVNGIADLKADLRTLVGRAVATFGSQAGFSKPAFDLLRQQITTKGSAFNTMSRADIQVFVGGTIAQVADAVVRAKQLATINVASQAERDTNQAAQAALVGPARLMYDSASEVLRNITPATGTHGLGIAPLIIIAAVVVAVILGAAAIVAITYWVDSSHRLEYASQQAEAICRASRPPCSAAQRAQIQHDLALGPYDTAAANFTNIVAGGITDTIKYGAAIGASVLGLYAAYEIWKWKRHKAKQGASS